jgi:FERM/RhoGEF/pleckstrin domain-containing protein 1
MVLQLQGTMMKMENIQKLLELKKDLTGIQDLAISGRVREQFSLALL